MTEPITMTPQREEDIRGNLSLHGVGEWRVAARDLLAEIDALRARVERARKCCQCPALDGAGEDEDA